MDKELKAAINEIVAELIDIKYEICLYVDEDLIELGKSFEGAIEKLKRVMDPESEPTSPEVAENLAGCPELEPDLADEIPRCPSEPNPAACHAAEVTEIMERRQWDLKELEEFFFGRHSVPNDGSAESGEPVSRGILPRILEVDALHEEGRRSDPTDD
jgi:hypothetical protein